jgi:subfamily B ATP-binding cassette protein HlyB/CyaB
VFANDGLRKRSSHFDSSCRLRQPVTRITIPTPGRCFAGGQRQRIAIARALITDPRILIFDEATSALDYESERVIQQNMKQIASGRTVVLIAHRLSTVRHANRIITIERGCLVEDGTHDELIRTNGRYAKLHYLQAGIHEVR